MLEMEMSEIYPLRIDKNYNLQLTYKMKFIHQNKIFPNEIIIYTTRAGVVLGIYQVITSNPSQKNNDGSMYISGARFRNGQNK